MPRYMLEHRPSQLCISSLTLAELHFGAEAKRSRELYSLISALGAHALLLGLTFVTNNVKHVVGLKTENWV